MRYTRIIFFMVTMVLLSFSNSLADEVQYTEVIDLVYEWSPQGEAIQVGDYMISGFGSVWSDTGAGEVIEVGSNAIKLGGLVKVLLVDKNENGFWLAEKVIVYSGGGVDSAMKELSETKRQQLITSQESSATDNDNTPTNRQSVELLYENGVWKN